MKRSVWFLFLFFLTGFFGTIFLENPEPHQVVAHGRDRSSLTLSAVGDLVMHLPIVNSARKTDGTYDFRPIFTEVRPYLSRADIAVAVLETQLDAPNAEYSGYPRFNTPGAIADALIWSGIDLVFLAHNHSLDQGFDGIKQTIAYLERIGLAYTGCRSNPKAPRYRIIEKNRIKLAFFSYTTITNGISPPKGKEWAVNILDFQQIAADIAEARRAGSDGIIFALHAGVEYQRLPSPEQLLIVEKLLALGVDIILGSHVHVIQPLEVTMAGGWTPGKRRVYFIAYSLGNFLSNQRQRYRDCGLMVNLRLAKEPLWPGIRIANASYLPLWVYRFQERGQLHYRILMLDGGGVYRARFQKEPEILRQLDEVKSDTDQLIKSWNRNRKMIFEPET